MGQLAWAPHLALLLPRPSETKTGPERAHFGVSEALGRLTAASPARRQARREQETELVLVANKQKAAGREGQDRLEPSPPLHKALQRHGRLPSTFIHSFVWQTWLVWERLPVKGALSPPSLFPAVASCTAGLCLVCCQSSRERLRLIPSGAGLPAPRSAKQQQKGLRGRCSGGTAAL